MKELDYTDLYREVIHELKAHKEIVLATCVNNKVTARVVNCMYHQDSLYFITSRAYNKYKQIKKNNNVALSINNIQIEGRAEDLSHPLNDENSDIKSLYEQDASFFEYFTRYSRYKNSVLIKIRLELITLNMGNGGYKYLNLKTQKACSKGRI